MTSMLAPPQKQKDTGQQEPPLQTPQLDSPGNPVKLTPAEGLVFGPEQETTELEEQEAVEVAEPNAVDQTPAEQIPAEFAGKPKSYEAAKSFAGTKAARELESATTTIKAAHEKRIKAFEKPKNTKTKTAQKAMDAYKLKVAASEAQQNKELEDAAAANAARMVEILADVKKIATAGAALSDDALSAVLGMADHDAARAQSLADLAVAGGLPLASAFAAEADMADLVKAIKPLLGTVTKQPAATVVKAARLLCGAPEQAKTWLTAMAGKDQLDTAIAELDGKDRQGMATTVAVAEALGLEDTNAKALLNWQVGNKGFSPKAADLNWLLGLKDDDSFDELVSYLTYGDQERLTYAKSVISAVGDKFTVGEALGMARTKTPKDTAALLKAIEIAPDPHVTEFVGLYLGSGSPALEDALRIAFRTEALLMNNHAGLKLTIRQPDVPYGRGQNNPFRADNIKNNARTGFIKIAFPDGSSGEVHTHWNGAGTDNGLLTSMHIQVQANNNGDTKNGIELHEWTKFLPKLPQKILEVQDAGKSVGNKLHL